MIRPLKRVQGIAPRALERAICWLTSWISQQGSSCDYTWWLELECHGVTQKHVYQPPTGLQLEPGICPHRAVLEYATKMNRKSKHAVCKYIYIYAYTYLCLYIQPSMYIYIYVLYLATETMMYRQQKQQSEHKEDGTSQMVWEP